MAITSKQSDDFIPEVFSGAYHSQYRLPNTQVHCTGAVRFIAEPSDTTIFVLFLLTTHRITPTMSTLSSKLECYPPVASPPNSCNLSRCTDTKILIPCVVRLCRLSTFSNVDCTSRFPHSTPSEHISTIKLCYDTHALVSLVTCSTQLRRLETQVQHWALPPGCRVALDAHAANRRCSGHKQIMRAPPLFRMLHLETSQFWCHSLCNDIPYVKFPAVRLYYLQFVRMTTQMDLT